MKKKILICGATGFLGRNMAEHFANKDEFEVYGTHFMRPPLQHPRIKMLHVDLTDKRAVEEVMRGKDILVQAAATTSGSKDIVARPHIHVTDNAVMSSLIFRAAHEQKTPQIIFFSCSIMYQSERMISIPQRQCMRNTLALDAPKFTWKTSANSTPSGETQNIPSSGTPTCMARTTSTIWRNHMSSALQLPK